MLLPSNLNAQEVIWNFNNHPTSYSQAGFFDYTEEVTSTLQYVFEARIINSHPYNSGHLSINGTTCPFGSNITETLTGSGSMPTNHIVNFSLNLPANTPQCATYTLEYRILIVGSSQPFQNWTGKTITVNDFAHVNPSTVNTPDLMIRDHDRRGPVVIGQTRSDFGEEPYQDWNWAWDYRNITKSPDMWNRHFNDNGTTFQNPMHSIQSPANPNYVNVRIRNRGCAATPPDQQLNLYWTIARLWEPWARDWKHFTDPSGVALTNFIQTSSGNKPLGSPITLTDKYNYASNELRINIGGFNGGEEKVIAAPWIVPNPAWYTGNTTLPIQFTQNGQPVICLLARIDEGWRTDEGYYFNPPQSAGTGIVEYVSQNNNVATHNTHIINSLNGYKWQDANGNPRGIGGMVGVTGPNGGDAGSINIAFVRDTLVFTEDINLPDFTQHGVVRLYLDELLWERWLTGGAIAEGFSIDTAQVLIVTNPQLAVLYNINMNEGELAWLGTDAMQIPGAEPSENYICGYAIGAFDTASNATIGSPSHFEWHVLVNPIIEEDDDENEPPTIGLTSLQENEADGPLAFSVYPNPAKDFVLIAMNQTALNNTSTINVYDVSGKKVLTIHLPANDMTKPIKIDVSGLDAGVYYVELVGNQTTTTRKFVK